MSAGVTYIGGEFRLDATCPICGYEACKEQVFYTPSDQVNVAVTLTNCGRCAARLKGKA